MLEYVEYPIYLGPQSMPFHSGWQHRFLSIESQYRMCQCQYNTRHKSKRTHPIHCWQLAAEYRTLTSRRKRDSGWTLCVEWYETYRTSGGRGPSVSPFHQPCAALVDSKANAISFIDVLEL